MAEVHPTFKAIMNDQPTLDKMGTRRRLEIMNNEAQSTYGLLVRALFGLSAIVSIWQFAAQPSPLPIDAPRPAPYLAPQMSHHRPEPWLDRGS